MRARTAYYGLTWRMDAMVGQILTALEQSGLAGDTLVVYTSDHGDHVGDRGLWWKHTFYDESVKIPLVMRWPDRLPKGQRRSQPVSLIDLAPTLLEALAAPPLPNADGRSFLNVAQAGGVLWPGEVLAEYCTDATPAWTGGMAVRQRMLRTERWKLCYYHGYRPQLFDMDADPLEQRDLAEDARYADMRDALMTRLLADWDPDEIDRRMTLREEDKALIGAWGRVVDPPNAYHWQIGPEHNMLGLADGPEALP
jgi:choline-sulfatase